MSTVFMKIIAFDDFMKRPSSNLATENVAEMLRKRPLKPSDKNHKPFTNNKLQRFESRQNLVSAPGLLSRSA